MEAIIQQLKNYCDCFPELDGESPDKILEIEKNVSELIRYISSLTCWAKNPCETFLLSERAQLYRIDTDIIERCDCFNAILEVCMAYDMISSDSIKIELIELQGITKTVYELTDEEFLYDEDQDILRVNIGNYIEKCQCRRQCKKSYALKITYEAGYEQIPDCLLGMFCDLLHVIFEKNKCSCERCQACNAQNNTDVVIEYDEADTASPQIQSYIASLVVSGYKKQLGMISICDKCADDMFWGLVV